MTAEENFYGDYLPRLKDAETGLKELLGRYAAQHRENGDLYTVQHFYSRIKSPESMSRKLRLRGLPPDGHAAVTAVRDALGLRAICSFSCGVYHLAEWMGGRKEYEIVEKKDYIACPKPNGYRSLHLILQVKEGPAAGLFAELQIRTIALDFWASLEHQIKYKQEIAHEALIRQELKRCADEIASIDLTMQTIQELILDEKV